MMLSLWLLALVESAGSSSPQAATPAASTPSAQTTAAAPADPARLVFAPGTTGLVLVAVKTARFADYEAVITALKTALASATDADRAIAAGWQVFKAKEPDAKGNTLYVHWVPAPQADADYRPSLVLDRLSASLPEALLVKYRDALAGPPSRLSLESVATLGLTPVASPKR